MSVNVSFFGNMPDGKEVRLFTVKNSNGIILQVITLGATLQALYTPDKYGRVNDITVGFDSLYGHLNFTDYQGKTVGRYANRIANGSFAMKGKKVQLTQNEREKPVSTVQASFQMPFGMQSLSATMQSSFPTQARTERAASRARWTPR